ncbi:hypothetical protein BG011_005096 [Mortierella polycephala]|uniref:Uncharacterized protein n=1 Tax=Mortierella polycephala TaxID=41804 RepID=A0A9P6PZN7_9FUNG|nr:hypothetical protein BG011_005096 [Mortierella polycephala]
MDVVRITQALRHQKTPARASSSPRGGNALSTNADASASTQSAPLHGSTWDNTLHLNATAATANIGQENVCGLEQDSMITSCTSPTSTGSDSVSPNTPTFFSNSFSLASLMPSAGSVERLSFGFFGNGATETRKFGLAAGGAANISEIESLLLRSMPMFGNLASRD